MRIRSMTRSALRLSGDARSSGELAFTLRMLPLFDFLAGLVSLLGHFADALLQVADGLGQAATHALTISLAKVSLSECLIWPNKFTLISMTELLWPT